MKKRIAKLIVSCAACVCLALGFSVSASADVVGGAGLLGSALGSLGVDLLAGGSATMAMLAPWLSDDFSIVGALTGVADGYIKVGEDSVIIDGVQYDSIFLNPQMAAVLHTQAFDFVTQKAITDNSSGILASGTGFADGVPVYSIDNTSYAYSQIFSYPFVNGSYALSDTFHIDVVSGTPPETHKTVRIVNSSTASYQQPYSNYTVEYYPVQFRLRTLKSGGTIQLQGKTATQSGFMWIQSIPGSFPASTVSAFDYEYVAGVIDADPLPANYGFMSYVPSQTLAQAGFSAGTYVIDGGIGTDEIIELIQLLDEIYGQEQIKDAEFVEEIVPPVPPQPIDTPLGEVPYDDFLDTFGQSVYGKLDSISDGIDTVGQVIAGQGSDIIEAVDTAGQSVVEELEVIGGAIDTAGQSVVDSVEESTGILEEAIEAVEAKVDELVDSIAEVIDEIMTHPLDLFSAWLDRLPEIPAIKDIFDGIKRHVGIWHYVVEWLSCIGTFLAFFIGLYGDVAYCMVVPIYACVAGAICLAFYKRFAR